MDRKTLSAKNNLEAGNLKTNQLGEFYYSNPTKAIKAIEDFNSKYPKYKTIKENYDKFIKEKINQDLNVVSLDHLPQDLKPAEMEPIMQFIKE